MLGRKIYYDGEEVEEMEVKEKAPDGDPDRIRIGR